MIKVGAAFIVLCVWVFANGFWLMAEAPSHYTSCQAINWAKTEIKGKFRPDEYVALWLLESIKC